MAEESAVLLKNDGVLPLTAQRSPLTVLVTGPLADQKKEQLGTWIFDGEPAHSVTPLEALQSLTTNRSPLTVIYAQGLAYSRDKSTKDFAKVVEQARKADVILFFAGEEAILSGEARCRADISLPGAQTQLLTELKKTGKPIVLVVMAGRPLTIGAECKLADAVLWSFHAGTMTGPGIANVLTGQAVPCGRLPMTFPKMVGQIPLYYNRHNTGRPCSDHPMLIDDIPAGCEQFSIGASSYWLETPVEPLYPFGYGLSYTSFAYSETEVRVSGERIAVSGTITNTGKVDAYETPQLYVRQLHGDLVRPICELKGFQKIFIPAGESRTVLFELTPEQLGYWHEEKDGLNSRVWFATDETSFRVWIAPDSRCQTTPAEFTYTKK